MDRHELNRPARPFCEALEQRGVLCKETHERVIRLAPPLIISKADLEWGLEQVRAVLEDGPDARNEAVAELAGTTVAASDATARPPRGESFPIEG